MEWKKKLENLSGMDKKWGKFWNLWLLWDLRSFCDQGFWNSWENKRKNEVFFSSWVWWDMIGAEKFGICWEF